MAAVSCRRPEPQAQSLSSCRVPAGARSPGSPGSGPRVPQGRGQARRSQVSERWRLPGTLQEGPSSPGLGEGLVLTSLAFRTEETPWWQTDICRQGTPGGACGPDRGCVWHRGRQWPWVGVEDLGLAFYINKKYYYCFLKAEVGRSQNMAKLRVLAAGCSSHAQHQPVLGSAGGDTQRRSENEFSRIPHIQTSRSEDE